MVLDSGSSRSALSSRLPLGVSGNSSSHWKCVRNHVLRQRRSQAGSDRGEVGRFPVTDEVGNQHGVRPTSRFRATTAAASDRACR